MFDAPAPYLSLKFGKHVIAVSLFSQLCEYRQLDQFAPIDPWRFDGRSALLCSAESRCRTMARKQIVLLLEDSTFVALTIEEELTEAGFDIAGAFASCDSALKWLRTATPDAAILDVMLTDGSCHPVAAELRRRNVPFVVFSGRTRSETAGADFADAVWIDKPSPLAVLITAVRRVLQRSAQAELAAHGLD
jgi:CheY-like chemotaxis protein